MSVPLPKQALDGHCSAVHEDTLYVYSSTGLQSLPLKENATWSEETAGVLVTGPDCVKGVPGNDASKAALYVVGGVAEDSSYGGLQRYTFGDKTWETLSLPAEVMQSRTNHSAVYLQDSQSILVYAGSTPDAPSYLSSQTFLIETSKQPHNIQSFISTAAPANQPILQPWNSSHAVMAGGSLLSSEVHLFEPSTGWQPLGTNLSQPMPPGLRGAIVNGDDGSKVLETYDAGTSPNTVEQIVLLGAGGQTAQNGETVGSSRSLKRRRDLTLENWPAYNSTDAPTTTRTDYSVSQGSDGLAVIAGGNTESAVSLYDQIGNTWVDAGKFFNGGDQQPLQPSSTSTVSSTPTRSSTPSSSTTTAAGAGGGLSDRDRMLRTLGIVLGVLCGIAALFIIVLLFVRRRKMKRKNEEGYVEKSERQGNRMSFADRGASFMKEAGGSHANTPPPRSRYESPGASRTSLAIIAGKLGSKRNTPNHAAKGSMESTAHLVRDKNGTTIDNEPMEMLDIGDKKYLTVENQPRSKKPSPPLLTVQGASPEDPSVLGNRSSGWSRYFSTSQPNDLTHMPSAYTKDRQSDNSEIPPSTRSSEASRIPSSAVVAPLNIDFTTTIDGQRLSNVVFASPAFSDSREDLARRGSTLEGQKAQIENNDRPQSGTTLSSYARSTMSSDFYNGLSSANTPWTPVSNSFRDQGNAFASGTHSRAASSTYTASVHEQRLPSRGARGQNSGFFPGSGTSNFKPPKLKLGHAASPSADWAAPVSTSKESPLLKMHPTIVPAPAPQPVKPEQAHDRETSFPRLADNNPWAANAPTSLQAALALPRAPAPDRASTLTIFPRANNHDSWTAKGVSDLAPPKKLGGESNRDTLLAGDRDSTLTVFPRGVPSAYYANRPKEIDDAERSKVPMGSDLGWLNLGLGSGRA